jgi:Domain of unknown function (DUF4345)
MRALQIAVAIGGLVPVGAGLLGIVSVPEFAAGTGAAADLDSHYRYLSGLLLGIGLAFWTTILGIERNGQTFRLLTAIVFIGGLARLYGAVIHGLPGYPMTFGLGMELAVTPLLCLWQYRIACRQAREQDTAK